MFHQATAPPDEKAVDYNESDEIIKTTFEKFKMSHAKRDFASDKEQYQKKNTPMQLRPMDLCSAVERKLSEDGFLRQIHSRSKREDAIFIDGGTEKEVGVIKNADWWTLVPRPEKNANSPPDSDIEEEKTLLDGQYVLVEESDVVEAIAEFVALCVVQMPEVQQLTDEQMKGMIVGTFSEMKEKGALSQLWNWAQFLYTTYGWSATVFRVYTQPAIARMIVRALLKVATWVAIVVV